MAIIKNTNNNNCGGKRNPHTLFVGMKISSTNMENCMEVSQKTKNRTAI
jgi:hypothetical protein